MDKQTSTRSHWHSGRIPYHFQPVVCIEASGDVFGLLFSKSFTRFKYGKSYVVFEKGREP